MSLIRACARSKAASLAAVCMDHTPWQHITPMDPYLQVAQSMISAPFAVDDGISLIDLLSIDGFGNVLKGIVSSFAYESRRKQAFLDFGAYARRISLIRCAAFRSLWRLPACLTGGRSIIA